MLNNIEQKSNEFRDIFLKPKNFVKLYHGLTGKRINSNEVSFFNLDSSEDNNLVNSNVFITNKNELIVSEANESYLLTDKLSSIIESLEKEKVSKTLDEDITLLSNKITNIPKNELYQIYKTLVDTGFYIHKEYVLAYGYINVEKAIKELVDIKLKDVGFLEKYFSKKEILGFLVNNFDHKELIEKINIKLQKPINETLGIDFDAIFTNSDNVKIFFSKRENKLVKKSGKSKEILRKYEVYLFELGISDNTINNYLMDVRIFLKWIEGENLSLIEFDRHTIMEYYKLILKDHKISSFNKILGSLAKFDKYLVGEKIRPKITVIYSKDQIKDLTRKNVETYSLEEQEVIKDILNKRLLQPRTELIIWVLRYTGVRASELVGIKIGNIDFDKKILLVIGKGKKRRSIPIIEFVIDEINGYIEGDRNRSKYAKSSKFLFVSQRAEVIVRETVSKEVDKLNEYLDFRVYPHKFRHTLATSLVNNGVHISTVAAILGHSDIQTTIDYYVNTSEEDKKDAINSLE